MQSVTLRLQRGHGCNAVKSHTRIAAAALPWAQHDAMHEAWTRTRIVIIEWMQFECTAALTVLRLVWICEIQNVRDAPSADVGTDAHQDCHH